MSTALRIAVLGGTGKEGRGLALRWALHGHSVILGSRSPERAEAAAAELRAACDRPVALAGAGHAAAAGAASVVVLAVPWAAQRETALQVREALEGKVLIDVTVPLVPPRVDRMQLPGGESAVVALQASLGPSTRVVSAFQNVSAVHLQQPAHEIDCDVLVCADDPAAADVAIGLAGDARMRAWYAGPLANSAAVEGLTSILIAINKRYKARSSGIRITGVAPRGG